MIIGDSMENQIISINQLMMEDSTFTESSFISKVDNLFIMLYSGIMFGNLERVKHKLSNNVLNHYQAIIDDLNSKNLRQMYDELNVKSTSIVGIYKNNEKYTIEVQLQSRYMDYLVDKTTNKYVSGINTYRIEVSNHLVFTKRINARREGETRKCPGCNANIDSNSTGKCPYCGTFYDTENYDWILEDVR